MSCVVLSCAVELSVSNSRSGHSRRACVKCKKKNRFESKEKRKFGTMHTIQFQINSFYSTQFLCYSSVTDLVTCHTPFEYIFLYTYFFFLLSLYIMILLLSSNLFFFFFIEFFLIAIYSQSELWCNVCFVSISQCKIQWGMSNSEQKDFFGSKVKQNETINDSGC